MTNMIKQIKINHWAPHSFKILAIIIRIKTISKKESQAANIIIKDMVGNMDQTNTIITQIIHKIIINTIIKIIIDINIKTSIINIKILNINNNNTTTNNHFNRHKAKMPNNKTNKHNNHKCNKQAWTNQTILTLLLHLNNSSSKPLNSNKVPNHSYQRTSSFLWKQKNSFLIRVTNNSRIHLVGSSSRIVDNSNPQLVVELVDNLETLLISNKIKFRINSNNSKPQTTKMWIVDKVNNNRRKNGNQSHSSNSRTHLVDRTMLLNLLHKGPGEITISKIWVEGTEVDPIKCTVLTTSMVAMLVHNSSRRTWGMAKIGKDSSTITTIKGVVAANSGVKTLGNSMGCNNLKTPLISNFMVVDPNNLHLHSNLKCHNSMIKIWHNKILSKCRVLRVKQAVILKTVLKRQWTYLPAHLFQLIPNEA